MREADNQADIELSCEQMIDRTETEKGELDRLVGSYARVTTTAFSTDEPSPVTTELRTDRSGSADTRTREGDATPRLNNEILQREDDTRLLQQRPHLQTEFSQAQGHQLDGDERQHLREEIGLPEAKEEDRPADDNRKLKEYSGWSRNFL